VGVGSEYLTTTVSAASWVASKQASELTGGRLKAIHCAQVQKQDNDTWSVAPVERPAVGDQGQVGGAHTLRRLGRVKRWLLVATTSRVSFETTTLRMMMKMGRHCYTRFAAKCPDSRASLFVVEEGKF
jgi:hypothetical protein